MKKLKIHTHPKFLIAIVFLVFLFQSLIFYDPDFWWHIKVGELITKMGFPRTDPFSYTMATFPVVSHEWSIDVLLNVFYVNNTYWLLAIIFSAIALSAIFLAFKTAKLFISIPKGFSLYSTSIFLISSAGIVSYMGVRPQVLSWLFLSGLLYFLNWVLLKKKIKYLFILPFGFLLWANIHGSFAAGLIALAIFSLGYIIRTRELNIALAFASILSLCATLINPYGLEVWREVCSSVLDSSLRWRVQEWQPAVFSFNIALICLIAFSASFLYRYHRKFLLEEKLLYIFFLTQAISSTRHVPLWTIITIPVLLKGGAYLFYEVKKIKGSAPRLIVASKIIFVIFCIVFIVNSTTSMYKFGRISINNYYPTKAVEYLEQNSPVGNLFSEYAWGGYLIWSYPDKKVFIDGRMPSWRWNANITGETNNAMDDYIDLISGKLHHKKLFEKYNITTVLWPKLEASRELGQTSIWDSFQKSLGGGEPYYFNLAKDLERNNWRKVYEDDVAVIYSRE